MTLLIKRKSYPLIIKMVKANSMFHIENNSLGAGGSILQPESLRKQGGKSFQNIVHDKILKPKARKTITQTILARSSFSMSTNVTEKYLQISDFLEYILSNIEKFLSN